VCLSDARSSRENTSWYERKHTRAESNTLLNSCNASCEVSIETSVNKLSTPLGNKNAALALTMFPESQSMGKRLHSIYACVCERWKYRFWVDVHRHGLQSSHAVQPIPLRSQTLCSTKHAPQIPTASVFISVRRPPQPTHNTHGTCKGKKLPSRGDSVFILSCPA